MFFLINLSNTLIRIFNMITEVTLMKMQRFLTLKVSIFLSILLLNNLSFYANATVSECVATESKVVADRASFLGRKTRLALKGLFACAVAGAEVALFKKSTLLGIGCNLLPAGFVSLWQYNRLSLWKIRQSLKDETRLWNWMPDESAITTAEAIAVGDDDVGDDDVERECQLLKGVFFPAQIVANKVDVLRSLNTAINSGAVTICDRFGNPIVPDNVTSQNIRDAIVREIEELKGKMRTILSFTDADKIIRKYWRDQRVSVVSVAEGTPLELCGYTTMREMKICCNRKGHSRFISLCFDRDSWLDSRIFGYNYERASQDYFLCLEKFLYLRALQLAVAVDITEEQALAHARQIERDRVSAEQGRHAYVRPAAGSLVTVAAAK